MTHRLQHLSDVTVSGQYAIHGVIMADYFLLPKLQEKPEMSQFLQCAHHPTVCHSL